MRGLTGCYRGDKAVNGLWPFPKEAMAKEEHGIWEFFFVLLLVAFAMDSKWHAWLFGATRRHL